MLFVIHYCCGRSSRRVCLELNRLSAQLLGILVLGIVNRSWAIEKVVAINAAGVRKRQKQTIIGVNKIIQSHDACVHAYYMYVYMYMNIDM